MRVEMASGLFLSVAILLTINGSSGSEEDLAERGLENEKVWEAILYGYVIDPEAPSFLARGDKVFHVDARQSLAISSNAEMDMEYKYSDSEHTASKNVASSMSVSGQYGAFSGAASMEVSHTSDKSIKTVRMDALIKAIKYEVASKDAFRTFPQNFLTENFKKSVQALSVQEIEKRIGVFYATRMDLGGEIRKSYTMQATEDDTQLSVTAELEAEYKSGLMGASAKASVGVSSRVSNKKAQMKVEWSAKGGDTTVWLGKSFTSKGDTSVASIQAKWAETINDNNLYPFNYELGPMWELVKAVDMKKGIAFQKYLEKKWGDLDKAFNPSKFLPGADHCGFIQHYGGYCIHPRKWDGGRPDTTSGKATYGTDLVIYPGCDEERLYFCVRKLGGDVVELYHMNSGYCIVPHTRGQNDDKLVVGSCGRSNAKWRWVWGDRNIQWVNNGKCWHPHGGKAHPKKDSKIVTWSGCNEYKLQFQFHDRKKNAASLSG